MSQRPSRFDRDDNVVVMKFGGTSVEDAAAIRRLISIVQSRRDAQPVIVVSALARVTDQLLEAGRAAATGRIGAALASVRDIYVRHELLADSLVSESAYGLLDRELRGEFKDLEALLPVAHPARKVEPLSPREIEVLGMMAEGISNKEIAARMTISEHTVKFHVASVMGKLRAGTRTEAVMMGVRMGLIMV